MVSVFGKLMDGCVDNADMNPTEKTGFSRAYFEFADIRHAY